MLKTISSMFLVLLISGSANAGIISTLYGIVLGNQDARLEYKELVHQALTELGVEDPKSVSVKQMNGIGPAFARMNLSSFTAIGIWLDENYLDHCTQEEKLFHIYHEASHFACKHHQKIVAGSSIVLVAATLGMIKLNSLLSSGDDLTKYVALAGSGLAALTGAYYYVLPQIVKKQEKEADILAAQALIQSGKEEVVDAHIKDLECKTTGKDTVWWYSIAEQQTYLKELQKA